MTTTKQFGRIDFSDALFMNPADARALLEEVQASDASNFEDAAKRNPNASADFYRRYTEYDLKKAVEIFDRANAKPKTYDIYYIVKANGRQTVHCMTVIAGCVKDAKTVVRYAVLRHTGHNAFTMTNGKLPKGWSWDYIAERDGMTVEELMERARKGYTFA